MIRDRYRERKKKHPEIKIYYPTIAWRKCTIQVKTGGRPSLIDRHLKLKCVTFHWIAQFFFFKILPSLYRRSLWRLGDVKLHQTTNSKFHLPKPKTLTYREGYTSQWQSQGWGKICPRVPWPGTCGCGQRWGCQRQVVAGPSPGSLCHPRAPLDGRGIDQCGTDQRSPPSAQGSLDSVDDNNLS